MINLYLLNQGTLERILLLLLFLHQMQSYFTNVKQTPYLDLVIKLMNSKDSFVNLRLMNFVALLIDLRDSRFIITSE